MDLFYGFAVLTHKKEKSPKIIRFVNKPQRLILKNFGSIFYPIDK